MVFTVGQNVNVTTNSVTTSGKISKLDPLGSKLYAIKTTKEEVKPEPINKYNIYLYLL